MSVEKKIRDFLEKSTVAEASYPGMGKNKESEAPMQGSSQKADSTELVKGAGADAAAKAAGATTLSASNSNGEKKPVKQGDSQENVPVEDLGKDEPGKVAAAKMSKTTKQPTGKGAGQAPGFVTKAETQSVVNMPSSKGNVQQEEVETDEELEAISEEEYNALSDEEKAQYELVEIEEATTEEVADAVTEKKDFVLDVNALFGESELSEEFRTKAASLFEAVVAARVADIRSQLEEEAASSAAELVEAHKAQLVEQVDAYLNYVAEQWIAENKVAVETGLRTEVAEDFLSGLKSLFEQHYIEIPEDKVDVVEAMQTRIAELEESLNSQMTEAVGLNSELAALKRSAVIAAVTEGLAQTEAEKFATLVEDVSFEDEATFTEKLNVIKENYFPKTSSASPSLDDDEAPVQLAESSSTVMKYAQALGRYTFSK